MLTINYLFLHIVLNTKDVVPLPSDEYKLCLNGWIWRCHSRELGKNAPFPTCFFFKKIASRLLCMSEPASLLDFGMWGGEKWSSLEVRMAKLQWWR